MRKLLLFSVLLLSTSGAFQVYGQEKPTVTFELLNDEHCETGTATLKLTLTGSGNYDVIYRKQSDTEDVNITAAIVGDNEEIPLTASNSTTITILKVHDENYPIGGESGTILGDPVGIITIDKMPTVEISDLVKTCRRSITLDANPGNEYTAAYWEPTAGGSFDDVSLSNAKFTAEADGNYSLIYKVENGVCEDFLSKDFEITYQAPPSATINIADNRICRGNTSTLNITSISERFPMVLNYSDGTNTIAHNLNANDVSIPLSPDETTTYTMLSIIDREQCDLTLSDKLELKVDDVPVANAGFFDNSICGSTTTLNAQLSNDDNTGSWTIIDHVDGSGLSIDDITNPKSGISLHYNNQNTNEEYTIRLTEVNVNNPECTDYDDVVVNFDKKPENVSLGEDTLAYLDKLIVFSTTGLTEMPIEWTLSENLIIDDLNPELIEVSNLEMGDNKIICTIANGTCDAVSAEKNIRIENIYQTTGFSPDGDLINEMFKIGGAENVEENRLVIFDITGKLVYQAENFCHKDGETEDGWDGIPIGEQEPKYGTYYYIFEGTIDGTAIEPIKNYLIIKGSK